jgi:hypothetical protein
MSINLALFSTADSLTSTMGDQSPNCDTCPDGYAVRQLNDYQVCARCLCGYALALTIVTNKPVRLWKRGRPRKVA